MAGQTMIDRLTAAKHSIAGHGLAKSVCKATTEEVMGPKKKHIDYLLQCTNEPNVSIPQMADLLIERTQNNNWVVVFKALITIHNVMNYGNERFTQYLASNNCTFNLGNFLDKSGVQGYDMSTYIRRYAKYLNEKAFSYRSMAFDFCKIKRGKNDGTLRTMTGEKLLKALPVLQNQVDALLEFDCTSNELTNGVINACFMLMFKDLIRLFACYNDGIINLLEKYFDMPKKQAREALDFYKKFLTRMDRVSEFLKVAESVGIDKGDIPDLAKAPSSLLEALEAHLAQLEGNKKGEKKSKQPESVSSAISSLAASASGGPGASTVSEDEKRKIIEEESRQLQMLKEDSEKSTSTNPFANALENQDQRQAEMQVNQNNPFSSSLNNGSVTSPSGGLDLLGAGSPGSNHATSGMTSTTNDDLLGLVGANPFGQSMGAQPQVSVGATDLFGSPAPAAVIGGSPWGTPAPSAGGAPVSAAASTAGFTSDAQFAAVFGSSSPQNTGGAIVNSTPAPPPGSGSNISATGNSFDGFGEVMRPMGTGGAQPAGAAQMQGQQPLVQGNLDMSLSSLASNLNINSQQGIKKQGHQWGPQGEKKLTGGTTWTQPMVQAAPGLTTMAQPMTTPMMGPRSPIYPMAPAMNGMSPMNGMGPSMTNGINPWQGAGMMGAQAGFGGQQMSFQQQPMGMQAQQGMFMAPQQGMQPQQPMFNQPRPPQPGAPNDPFGSLL